MVLLQHFTPGHNSNLGWRSIPFKVADLGWTGVDLFFVLSGFLITGILLKAKATQRPLTNFVIRRFLRIVPAYYLALFLVLVILPAVDLLPVQSLSIQLPLFAYVSNFFWPAYDRWTQIGMSHFWSLALEMQFYVLWPLLVYRLRIPTLAILAAGAVLASTVARGFGAATGVDPTITFGWTPFRWDGLLLGSLVAMAVHEGVEYQCTRGYVWGTMLLTGAFAMYVLWFDHGGGMWMRNRSTANVFFTAAFPVAFSGLFAALLFMSLQSCRLANLLGARVLKPLARYSYGVYIIHFICAPSFEKLFGPSVIARWLAGNGSSLPIYLYFAAASSASILLAALSFHLFESHFLKLKSRFP